jgi:hypothetical protein
LKIFENKPPRRILGPVKYEVAGQWKDYITNCFIMFFGRLCQGVGDVSTYLDIHLRILLKLISIKYNVGLNTLEFKEFG